MFLSSSLNEHIFKLDADLIDLNCPLVSRKIECFVNKTYYSENSKTFSLLSCLKRNAQIITFKKRCATFLRAVNKQNTEFLMQEIMVCRCKHDF